MEAYFFFFNSIFVPVRVSSLFYWNVRRKLRNILRRKMAKKEEEEEEDSARRTLEHGSYGSKISIRILPK